MGGQRESERIKESPRESRREPEKIKERAGRSGGLERLIEDQGRVRRVSRVERLNRSAGQDLLRSGDV